MAETTEMIKAIANDSKVRIYRIVENYEQLEKENAELKERVKEQSEKISELTQELDDVINRFE